MEYEPAPSVYINPLDLNSFIEACQTAAGKLSQITGLISLAGHLTQQEWAHDAVSLDIARLYEEQVYQSNNSNYAALLSYNRELSSVIVNLQQVLANYRQIDENVANSMDQL
jgi:hypothetical protein